MAREQGRWTMERAPLQRAIPLIKVRRWSCLDRFKEGDVATFSFFLTARRSMALNEKKEARGTANVSSSPSERQKHV